MIEELKKDYDKKTIIEIFSIVENGLLIKIEINRKQISLAGKISKTKKIPFGDVLHAVLAKDNDALLVTRDHHFEELQDLVIIKKPEELI